MLRRIMETMCSPVVEDEVVKDDVGSSSSVVKEDDVNKEASETTINGINVMSLQSRNVYSFGLQLMDLLFTKDELSSSLLFISKKSEKPGLDPQRVNQLLSILYTRYGTQWDLKLLVSKANQKCRDSIKECKAH